MDEFEIIRRFFTRPGRAGPGVRVGIGDDAAVLRPPPGAELVIATDSLARGTHFPDAWPPDAIGFRALAVNLSDLAAMGAEPLWCTLSLSLEGPEAEWLEPFAAGLFELADRHGVELVGGDTIRGPLVISVTVIGHAPAGQAVTRAGAVAGDGIYVTGSPGEAGYAWRACAAGQPLTDDDPLAARFLAPEPRLREGLALRGVASAMIDVSDGLHLDLGRLLTSSGVGADAETECLPVSPALTERVGDEQASILALTGGDDYELCFTVPPAREAALAAAASAWPVPVTRIGTVTSAPGLRWRRGGRPWAVPESSHAHF